MFGLSKRERQHKAWMDEAALVVPALAAIATEALKQDDEKATLRAELAQAMKERSRAIAVGDDFEQEAERLRDRVAELETANQRQKDEWLAWAAKREALERDAARYRELRHEAGKACSMLHQAMIGACNCDTKTPEAAWHNGRCFYRLLSEQADRLEALLK